MNFGSNSWYKKWWGILLLILLFLLLIFITAMAFYVRDIRKTAKTQKDIPAYFTGDKYDIIDYNNYSIGAYTPKLIINEFADFACPYCKDSFTNIREMSIRYKDRVKIIYHDYPIHDESQTLALAARCAGEQGLFWPMHDKLFQNQGITMISEAEVLATQIGVDIKRYKDCIQSKKYSAEILKDYAQGQKLGITGTPTWFFNGYKIEGDNPSDIFVKLVEEGLK